MEKIPYSFLGYNREVVKEIIERKDFLLDTQQKDINYLRNEISRLEKSIQRQENP